jgi:hypothetical protein
LCSRDFQSPGARYQEGGAIAKLKNTENNLALLTLLLAVEDELIKKLHEPKDSCSYQKLKMRMKGLEPSLLSELEPKSSASANSATSASVYNYTIINYFWE